MALDYTKARKHFFTNETSFKRKKRNPDEFTRPGLPRKRLNAPEFCRFSAEVHNLNLCCWLNISGVCNISDAK